MPDLHHAIHSALQDCLKIERNESILILADKPLSELGYTFYQKSQAIAKKSYLTILPEVNNHGAEPPRFIATMMGKNDVVIMLTSRSLSHTKARRRATQKGTTRIISLPGVTKETLIRTLTGNYKQLIYYSRKLADILTIGRSATLTTKKGTHLTFSISRMKGKSDTGMIHQPGQFSNLPAGEGCIGPVQGSTEGILILDGSFPQVGLIKKPVKMSIKAGQIVRISGKEEAEKIRKLLRPFGKDGRNVAEIGIGTNPNAKMTGLTLEDEKVLGTMHVGFGNNISFGGKVDVKCHFDGVVRKATLVIDGKTILEDGELKV